MAFKHQHWAFEQIEEKDKGKEKERLTAIAASTAVFESDPLEPVGSIDGLLLGSIPPAAKASVHADVA